MTEVIVDHLPNCDICVREMVSGARIESDIALARFDGVTKLGGRWGYMCETHFQSHGIGLGTGVGQRLITREESDDGSSGTDRRPAEG